MYEFRNGILIKWNGVPIWASGKPITSFKVVWWMPTNWFVLPYQVFWAWIDRRNNSN